MTQSEVKAITTPFPLRILIADDNQETRRTTRLMLSLISGIKVVAIAQNGREAIEMSRQYRPDIAIMDVKMPGISGLEAIRLMMRDRPELACIVISTERERHTLEEAMTAGARDYLLKPFTSDQLMIAIRRISQVVLNHRAQFAQADKLRQQRDAYLLALAEEYTRNQRTDEKAMAVYEELAANPHCDGRWLTALALIYVLNQQWAKLKLIAERLDQRASLHGPEKSVSEALRK
jgi:YesN/AraC family two-component response regulator